MKLTSSPSHLRLVNLVIPAPGIKYKQSAMPFVQMENISHFLNACQQQPLNLLQHDVFLTVDLYEQKDPAQVLQCLGAFSRAAHGVNPSRVTSVIGPKSASAGTPTMRGRGTSVTSNTSSAYSNARGAPPSASGRLSPTKGHVRNTSVDTPTSPGGSVSSWSRRDQENATAPAWNIAQYGYMGGASQGNLGIQFGGRRQIIGDAPKVPSLAEKERIRKEKEAEEEEEDRRRRAARQEEEDRAREEEERRWEQETNRLRDQEKQRQDDERRKWEEEERQWKITEERRKKEDAEAQAKLDDERSRARSRSPVKLRGQYLSQYQAERGIGGDAAGDDEGAKRRALEKQLELARQREAEYEKERSGRGASLPVIPPGSTEPVPTSSTPNSSRARSRSRHRLAVASPPTRMESWSKNDKEVLQTRDSQSKLDETPEALEPVPEPTKAAQTTSPRPLPDPTFASTTASYKSPVSSHNTGGSSRPLPDPATYQSPPTPKNRTDRFLASNPAPVQHSPTPTYSRELGATAERDAEDRRRVQSQTQTKAGGWASKSLLEREMEMERERQREWEESQRETAKAVRSGDGVDGIGGGIDGRWDVGQWAGYTGGDNQNKGGQGIGAGRRQIVGPREMPGSNR